MNLLTIQHLLSHLDGYLAGKVEFLVIREFVFEYYEAEMDLELDDTLEEVFPVLLPYLLYEESEGDPDRDARLRRVGYLLSPARASYAERTVFGLEFDTIRELTSKYSDGVISKVTYEEQMEKLSPVEYDVNRLIAWANAHRGLDEPANERIL